VVVPAEQLLAREYEQVAQIDNCPDSADNPGRGMSGVCERREECMRGVCERNV
jgi:hypothetical protein